MLLFGGAFQKIVTSLVNDIIMPAISIFTGNVDFSDLSIKIGESSIKYGAFLTAILDFLLIAFCIFLVIKYINKLNRKLEAVTEESIKKLEKKGILKRFRKKKKEEPKPAPTTKECPYCFTSINIKATRCPECTSIIDMPEEQ